MHFIVSVDGLYLSEEVSVLFALAAPARKSFHDIVRKVIDGFAYMADKFLSLGILKCLSVTKYRAFGRLF